MNSTSINHYISSIEAENIKLKTLVQDKIALIERLDAEIFKLHQKLEVDCESEVGSCDEPIYEFATDSDSDSDSETDYDSEPTQKVRRKLSPSYDCDSEHLNDKLGDAINLIAKEEKNEHKKAVFQKAALAIYNLPFDVKNGAELSSGPKKIAGIGKNIAFMIDEFIATGKITRGINTKMASAFDVLAAQMSQDEFRSKAYRNAARVLSRLESPITSGKAISEGPHKIQGIGKGIGKMIDEFLSTGKFSRVQE